MAVSKHGKQWRVTYRWQGKIYREQYPSAEIASARDREIAAAKDARTFTPKHELLSAEGNPSLYGKGLTVQEMMETLLTDYGPRKWKPNIVAANKYRADTYIVPYLGYERLSELSVKRVERFYLECGASPSVLEKISSLLKVMMSLLFAASIFFWSSSQLEAMTFASPLLSLAIE